MKIAIVLDSRARGGAERQGLFAARELTRQGRDVELIYYHQVPHPFDPAGMENTPIVYLPKEGTYLRFLIRLRNYFREKQFDVVHGFKSSPTLYAALAGRSAGVPVILGGIRCEYDDRGWIRRGHRFVNRFIDGWVVNAKATTDSLVRGFGASPGKVFVVYNGIEPDSFVSTYSSEQAKQRLDLDPKCPVVSIFAVIRPQKNHELFIETAARVAKTLPATRFLVVGDGDQRQRFEQLARSRGAGENIKFLGIRSDIPDLLAATDVSVLTSHYEGLANALLEAMAVGKPVVTTGYTGAEELVTNGYDGFITPMGDADAMAGRICELLRDSSLRRRLGENGRQTVATRFAMPAMASNLYAVYEMCMAKSKRRQRAHEQAAVT
jgi:glycosyltransferase involved in cell wall biosynthesis